MSSFQFPHEQFKYNEIKNIKILIAMLKDDARKQPKVRINPFKLITFRKYGYIKNIIAQCKYCSAKIKFKGYKTESDHFNDESHQESNTNNDGREKIIDVSYRLVEFNNLHEHNKENTSKEEAVRKKSLRNEMIIDHYQILIKEGANPNYIKNQLAKKFNMTEYESQKIISPYKKMQTLYKIAKQRMRSMNFTIIEKVSDTIDVGKIKSPLSSYVDFPNEFTVITPIMTENFIKYGHTVYFGLYPQYISQSKKLILVGGFYGINEHHKFVPFANVILTLVKKEEEIIIFNSLSDLLEKEDDDIIKVTMSILKTFFNYSKKIDENRNILLVIRQTNNNQAAIYETRKEITNLNFIYCFREKLNFLEAEVNKRYCNDSASSEQKLDFIISLYTLVKTLDEEEYNTQLKDLFKKANTNNTLLLQKLTQDSHLFCFCKIKESCNNLYDQCIDDHLKKKYKNMIQTEQRTNHMYMKNIMSVINTITKQETMAEQSTKVELKPAINPTICYECRAFRSGEKILNEAKIFQEQIPELRNLKYKICVKTYTLILKQMVKNLSVKSYKLLDLYKQKQYFVFKNGIKFKIVQDEDEKLNCDCLISQKYGIPCSHELFICANFKIPIEKQLKRWILQQQ